MEAPVFHRYIRDEAHYAEVLLRVREVKKTLWIGTADLKDVFVMRGKRARPFLGEVADLIEKGVSVRLIHAKEPGPNFRKDFDRYPALVKGLERVLCPRVHFKMLIFDLQAAYIGSANLTGAGIGMKSDGKRNFEAGIWTDDPGNRFRGHCAVRLRLDGRPLRRLPPQDLLRRFHPVIPVRRFLSHAHLNSGAQRV